MRSDAASVLIEGPWEHRFVTANGARFHVAELGEGPLVLLLHGFAQFWYAWRAQLVALSDAGYRACAMDLRGYGASDKPPRGYDTYTATADAASVIRALGETDAIVIGQGLGGWMAWATPSLQPGAVRALASLSMPHPRIMRHATVTDARQAKANRYVLDLQKPFVPEREMTRDDAYVENLLRQWSSDFGQWPTPADVRRYADAMALPFVAHSAAEHFRWLGRSQIRQDGPLFHRRIRVPVPVPVLQLQGTEDSCVIAEATTGSERYAGAGYRYRRIDGAGHFLAEEAPERVNRALIDWLDDLDI